MPAPVAFPEWQQSSTTPVGAGLAIRWGEDGTSATYDDSLAKVMHRKATVNFDSPGTFKSAKSFLSFSTPHSTANLNSVGVSLGNSVNDIHVSTKSLRHIEFDRLKVTPKALSKSDTTLINEDEELHANTDGQLLSHLVGEVSKVDFDEATVGSIYELTALGRKSNSFSTKRNVGSRKWPRPHNFQLFLNEWCVQ
jgi:hypothetical protein